MAWCCSCWEGLVCPPGGSKWLSKKIPVACWILEDELLFWLFFVLIFCVQSVLNILSVLYPTLTAWATPHLDCSGLLAIICLQTLRISKKAPMLPSVELRFFPIWSRLIFPATFFPTSDVLCIPVEFYFIFMYCSCCSSSLLCPSHLVCQNHKIEAKVYKPSNAARKLILIS